MSNLAAAHAEVQGVIPEFDLVAVTKSFSKLAREVESARGSDAYIVFDLLKKIGSEKDFYAEIWTQSDDLEYIYVEAKRGVDLHTPLAAAGIPNERVIRNDMNPHNVYFRPKQDLQQFLEQLHALHSFHTLSLDTPLRGYSPLKEKFVTSRTHDE